MNDSLPIWMEQLGWVLVHFLWQGVVIGAMAWVAFISLRRASSSSRYVLLCAALLACGLAPVATWFSLQAPTPQVSLEQPVPGVPTPAVAVSAPAASITVEAPTPSVVPRISSFERFSHAINAALPSLVALWSFGVALLSLRLVYGWLQVRRFRASGLPIADPQWSERLEALARRLRIRQGVRLLESALVEVPTVIGWLRPVVLVPVAFFSGLPPGQIEAILAHELAHIRRHDYLVNLFQVALETLLFYHPVVWWLSRTIRQEREHCCDDLALQLIGDKATYARALASLEEGRSLPSPLALAASGGSLLQRIRRIAETDGRRVSSGPVFLGLVLILAFLGTLAWQTTLCAQVKAAVKSPPPASAPPKPVATEATVTLTSVPPKGVTWTRLAVDSQGAMGAGKTWTLLPGGSALQAQVPKGSYTLRLVGRSSKDELYFSEMRFLEISSLDPVDLRFDQFTRGYGVKGKLDASVPRPVKHGFVIAGVSTQSPNPRMGFLSWTTSAAIHPDGTFEVVNLPELKDPLVHSDGPGQNIGQLELIATCEGFVSKDPGPLLEDSVGPQSFAPPISQPITVAMEQTGGARIPVLNPQGKPLKGASVQFSPNQSLCWMSSPLGLPFFTAEKMLRLFDLYRAEVTIGDEITAKYTTTTDDDGVAVVKGLPPGLESCVIGNTAYDMPYRPRNDSTLGKYEQNVLFTINPGEQTNLEVRLIPKIAPIPVPNSTSPDGKYTLSIEPIGNKSSYRPQALVISTTAGIKPPSRIVAPHLPRGPDRKVDLISPTDVIKAEWDATSTFLVFTVQRKDHLEGIIVSVQNSAATTDLDVHYNPPGRLISYEFVGKRTLLLKTGLPSGKTDIRYSTVGEDGVVQGGDAPPPKM